MNAGGAEVAWVGTAMRGAALILLALGALASAQPQPARAAGELPYLYEQLKKPAYKASLMTILKGQKSLPPWIGIFLKTMNGVANPGTPLVIDGQPAELYTVCQPHSCDGNVLYVIYAPGGARAWGLVTQDGRAVAVLGNPSDGQRKALMAAMSQ
jgi:Inhibitor of vertebrate lysozyme (Ivy)